MDMLSDTGSHPLKGVGLKVSSFKCFGDEKAGFDEFLPINIIIGRNNSGKSALVDAMYLCTTSGKSYVPGMHARSNRPFKVSISQRLDEESLQRVFRPTASGGGVPGSNHWIYGKQFVGQKLTRTYTSGWNIEIEEAPEFEHINGSNRRGYLQSLAQHAAPPFSALTLVKISAERDVPSETKGITDKIQPNGVGTTDLIRRFINSDSLPRDLVEVDLLRDLNTVYKGDSRFDRIMCQEDGNGTWEIFLREENKGDIRLSQSGSSLKSIFIILSMLRLSHVMDKNLEWSKSILVIEEPENNLHPALLRRLLTFLAEARDRHGFTLIITTHSPIGIDWSSRRPDSQIIHVLHDGSDAITRTATSYLCNRKILDDLDIRASEILQANGVIWVEGPSDRIYLRRWLDLFSMVHW